MEEELVKFIDLTGVNEIEEDILKEINSDYNLLHNDFVHEWNENKAKENFPTMDEITNYMTQKWHNSGDELKALWLPFMDKSIEVTSAKELYDMFEKTINEKIDETTYKINKDSPKNKKINFVKDYELRNIFEMILREAEETDVPLVIKDQHGDFYLNTVYKSILRDMADQIDSTITNAVANIKRKPKTTSKLRFSLKSKIFNKDFYSEFKKTFETTIDVEEKTMLREREYGLNILLSKAQEKLKTLQQQYRELDGEKEKIQHELLTKIQQDKFTYEELKQIRELQMKSQKDEKEYEEKLKKALDENPTFSKNVDSLTKLIDSARETIRDLFPYAVGGSVIGGGIGGGYLLSKKEEDKYNISNTEFQKNLSKLNFKDPRMARIRRDFIKSNEDELDKITNTSLKTNGRHKVLLHKALSLGYLPKNVNFN